MDERRVILVVEDDGDIREAVQLILEEDGYQVVPAGDGREAISVLRSGVRPCLILLDLMMPGMNGWQFYDILCKDPALSSIPVVVMSAASAADLPKGAFPAAYLRKPLKYDDLISAVARHSDAERSVPEAAPAGA